MSDIRINALATTASTTASDDYIAIDGSANGTRKLSAYSPTFGGNLTVSGGATVSGSVSGYNNGELIIGGTGSGGFSALSTRSTGSPTMVFDHRGASNTGSWSWRNGTDAGTTAMSLSASGNLTVSGTGTSSVAGTFTAGRATNAIILDRLSDNTTYGLLSLNGATALAGALGIAGRASGDSNLYYVAPTGYAHNFYINGSSVASLTSTGLTVSGTGNNILNASGGNLLIGTTTDSSTGKLQLASSASKSAGIGFGDDTAFYRLGVGSLAVDHMTGTNPTLHLAANGTSKAKFQTYGDELYIETLTAGKSIYFRTGVSTTALTLDSSQRCILAGALRLNNAYTAGAPTATGYVTLQDSAGTTYKVLVGT